MVGQYVRMVVAPKTRIGTVRAMRVDEDRVSILFHQDPRLAFALPDMWLQRSEVEECVPPTDEQIRGINEMRIRDE